MIGLITFPRIGREHGGVGQKSGVEEDVDPLLGFRVEGLDPVQQFLVSHGLLVVLGAVVPQSRVQCEISL